LRSALRPTTALVSIMTANHEIGVIQPLAEIARLAHGAGALVHSDAAQAAGKIRVDVAALGVDLMSLSAHKMYGPKGVGALYLRRGVQLAPLFAGGGQERGLRPGTLPTPLCVGFGAACRIARSELESEAARLRDLCHRLYRGLTEGLDGVQLNGGPEPRLPHNLNVRLTGVDAGDLLDELPDLALATGSACASATREPSPVLRALGLDDEAIQSSIRIGLGRTSSELEVDYATRRIIEVARAL
jgi:cysteine desulfurase